MERQITYLNNHTGKHTAVGHKEQVVMLTKNEAVKPAGTSLVTTMTVRTSRQLPRARFIQYVLTVLFGRNAKPDGRTDHPAGQAARIPVSWTCAC
jgi:hypothetical protein